MLPRIMNLLCNWRRAATIISIAFIFIAESQSQDDKIYFNSDDPLWNGGKEYPLTLRVSNSPTIFHLVVQNGSPESSPVSKLQIDVESSAILGLTLDTHLPLKGSFSNYCEWITKQMSSRQSSLSISSLLIPIAHGMNNFHLSLYSPQHSNPSMVSLLIPAKITLRAKMDDDSHLQQQIPPMGIDRIRDSDVIKSDILIPKSDRNRMDQQLTFLPSQSQRINPCHLFNNQYPFNILSQMIQEPQLEMLLGNQSDSSLQYNRIILKEIATLLSPKILSTRINSSNVHIEGSSSHAVLLDIVIPPLINLFESTASILPIELQIDFPQFNSQSGIVLFTKSLEKEPSFRSLTPFDFIPVHQTEKFSMTQILVPSSSVPSSSAPSSSYHLKDRRDSFIVIHPSTPYRFLILLMNSPLILSDHWESPMTIAIITKDSEGNTVAPPTSPIIEGSDGYIEDSSPNSIVGLTFYWLVHIIFSMVITSMSLSVLGLLLTVAVYFADPDLFFSFMRNVPGASTSLRFSQLLAWLEGSAMPSSGPPDSADEDVEGGDSNKELQLTLLKHHGTRKNEDEENNESKEGASDSSKYQLHYKSASDNNKDDVYSFGRFQDDSSQRQPKSLLRQSPEFDSMGGLSLLHNSTTSILN